jgi:hypothetical protein
VPLTVPAPALLADSLIGQFGAKHCSLQFYRARVFGSFSHRNLRFGENQVWRFALSTASFEVKKEK